MKELLENRWSFLLWRLMPTKAKVKILVSAMEVAESKRFLQSIFFPEELQKEVKHEEDVTLQ